MPKKRTIQSNPYLAKNARCRFQWLITKGLAGRGFKNGYCTPNGYTLTSVLITAVLIGIIAVPLMKLSMQTGRIQQRSLNREKASFNALSIAQAGQKSNDISEVEALASEKGCTLEGDNGSYLATCTVGATKQSLGTGSKAFVLCDALSDSEGDPLTKLMKKVKPGREILKRGNSFYTIVDGPTWGEAEANAVNLGGHLVAINDAEENSFLVEAFKNKPLLYYEDWTTQSFAHIGLYDDKDGNYFWTNGSPVDYTNWLNDDVAFFPAQWDSTSIVMGLDKHWLAAEDQGKWENGTPPGIGGIAEIPRNSASNENDAQNCEG